MDSLPQEQTCSIVVDVVINFLQQERTCNIVIVIESLQQERTCNINCLQQRACNIVIINIVSIVIVIN